jgi:DNA-binding NarL/FixJ family response regulator
MTVMEPTFTGLFASTDRRSAHGALPDVVPTAGSADPLPRFVLVDFKPDRRAVMRSIVDLALGAGSVVAQVATLAEALAAVGSNSANAVILEIEMPPGESLASSISSLKETYRNLTVAVCSFRDDRATRHEAEQAGADAYLAKPVDIRQLRSVGQIVRDRIG